MPEFNFEIQNKNGLFSRLAVEPEGNEIDLNVGDIITLKGRGNPIRVTCDALGTGDGNSLTVYPEQIEDFVIEINGKSFFELLG